MEQLQEFVHRLVHKKLFSFVRQKVGMDPQVVADEFVASKEYENLVDYVLNQCQLDRSHTEESLFSSLSEENPKAIELLTAAYNASPPQNLVRILDSVLKHKHSQLKFNLINKILSELMWHWPRMQTPCLDSVFQMLEDEEVSLWLGDLEWLLRWASTSQGKKLLCRSLNLSEQAAPFYKLALLTFSKGREFIKLNPISCTLPQEKLKECITRALEQEDEETVTVLRSMILEHPTQQMQTDESH